MLADIEEPPREERQEQLRLTQGTQTLEADILEEAIKIATKTTAGSLTNIKCSLVSLSGIL